MQIDSLCGFSGKFNADIVQLYNRHAIFFAWRVMAVSLPSKLFKKNLKHTKVFFASLLTTHYAKKHEMGESDTCCDVATKPILKKIL